MNRGELRTQLTWILNANTSQTDPGFFGPSTDTNRNFHWALDAAYREEVVRAKQQGLMGAFRRRHAVTWTSGAETMAIPAQVKLKSIDHLSDETDFSPGTPVSFYDDAYGTVSGIYNRDKDTWGWYPAPSSDRSLVVHYLEVAEPLTSDADIPSLFPVEHHDLIAWSAAIWMRTVADEKGPPALWIAKQQDLRMVLWKDLSRGQVIRHPTSSIRGTSAQFDASSGIANDTNAV